MNIATALKQEISRVSRKESRVETQSLKKSSTQHRSDIAALKRRVTELERLVSRLSKGQIKKAPEPAPREVSSKVRFSPKTLATQRQRLGLSATEMGAILGVSNQSIYKWEDGRARPRASQLPAIAGLRKMGKKEVAAKLAGKP
jgi:DNA-binding transcriptional regulator YiaG